MKNFKDISKFFTIARANDMQIELDKNKCGGFQIDKGEVIVDNIQEIFDKLKLESNKIKTLKEKQLPSAESADYVTIGEFKSFLDLLDLDENMPIKLTFYNHSGSISESGLLQGVSVSPNGSLELVTMR